MQPDKLSTILIVDDEPTNITVLNAMLTGEYKVKVALNGSSAIEIANAKPHPDLILLDVVMDDMDGFEVCQILKQEKSTADIPIIFVTALNDSKNDQKGIKLGAVDIFNKPYSAALILKRIENHIALSDARNSLSMSKIPETSAFKEEDK